MKTVLRCITVAKVSRDDIITKPGLGMGERAAISMAKRKNLVLLLDEVRARKIAKPLGVKVIGTGRILIELKQTGKIVTVKELLELFDKSGYPFSDKIKKRILTIAEEF